MLKKKDSNKHIILERHPVLLKWKSLFNNLAKKAEVDRAVVYGVLTKILSILSAPLTLYLVITYFTKELQGFYYTFFSIVGLQIFIDLGFGIVILNFAAHEWAKLDLNHRGEIIGDSDALSRLVSLGQVTFKWFAAGGILFAFGLAIGGYIFFSQSEYQNINWKAPWLLLSAFSGVNFCLFPVWSLLMGCNQVVRVYYCRMIEGILRYIALWSAIILGARLWTASIVLMVCIIWDGIFLWRNYKSFFRKFFHTINGLKISWRHDIWPMQWKIAVSSVGGYFINWFFTPVIFNYYGAVLAGKMGISLSIIIGITTVSATWINTKAPTFGALVSKKRYVDLDRLFLKVGSVSISLNIIGSLILWGVIYILNAASHPFAERFLQPSIFGIFLFARVLIQSTAPFSVYLRAHKQEPYLILSIVTGILTGLSSYLFGKYFSVMAIALGFLFISAVFSFPYAIITWFRCRSVWHS